MDSLFLMGSLVLQWKRPPYFVHEQHCSPHSLAWACPRCGEIWARSCVEGSRFHFIPHECERCEALAPWLTHWLPGSLILLGSPDWNDSLPLSLWQRELEIHIRHAEERE